MKNIPIEAETAIRNSVIHLTSHRHERFLDLRRPIVGEPLTLDLKKSSLRINGKCDHPPPAEDVRFGVTIAGDISLKGTDGANPECMKARDELIAMYAGQVDAATKMTAKKSGDILAVAIVSQYVLPSGDVEPLAVSRGNRKLMSIEKEWKQAEYATMALPEMRSYLRECERVAATAAQLNTWVTIAGGGRVQDPVLVGQRDTAIRVAQNNYAATERKIQTAQQLIKAKPEIERDLNSLREVAALAHAIDGAPLPYRFYITVAGRDVDLIRWSPSAQNGDQIPTVLAQPVR